VCNLSLKDLQLQPSLRELELKSRFRTSSLLPTALLGLTASRAPGLQRITCRDCDGSAPLSIALPCESYDERERSEEEADEEGAGQYGIAGQDPPAWLPALEQSVSGGALRLCSSLRLEPEDEGVLSATASSAALSVLRRFWLPGGRATPPLMELVLCNLPCPRDVLAQLPAGLTHLHLMDCILELDSLVPVAKGLPRLRVLVLDAAVSAAALGLLLASAQQRGALTVHVWKLSANRAGKAEQLTREAVASIARLAAATAAPQPTPRVLWRGDPWDRNKTLASTAVVA
jgi:hypothetical protein